MTQSKLFFRQPRYYLRLLVAPLPAIAQEAKEVTTPARASIKPSPAITPRTEYGNVKIN